MKRDVHTDYDTWEKKYVTSSGLLRKYICEELKIDTILYSWLNRFAETYPEKLLLLHFNGEARQVNDYPEINKKYFPGHWVYETGSLLSEDCTSSQTHIQVKAIDYFAKSIRLPEYVTQTMDSTLCATCRTGRTGQQTLV